jgi:hypothetical protein
LPRVGGDILQAGMDFQVDAGGGAQTYQLWYQWLSPTVAGQTTLGTGGNPAGFIINSGDTIYIQVGYIVTNGIITGGFFVFANQTSRVTLPTIFIPLPPCANPNGSTAQWIVETPTQTTDPDPNTGAITRNQTTLPSFGDIVIDGGADGQTKENGPGDGTLINLNQGWPAANMARS